MARGEGGKQGAHERKGPAEGDRDGTAPGEQVLTPEPSAARLSGTSEADAPLTDPAARRDDARDDDAPPTAGAKARPGRKLHRRTEVVRKRRACARADVATTPDLEASGQPTIDALLPAGNVVVTDSSEPGRTLQPASKEGVQDAATQNLPRWSLTALIRALAMLRQLDARQREGQDGTPGGPQ